MANMSVGTREAAREVATPKVGKCSKLAILKQLAKAKWFLLLI